MVIMGFWIVCYSTLIGALILLVRWEPQRISSQRQNKDTALAASRFQARRS